MAAVLGLLLPLAYEFNPGLVLQVVAEGSGGIEVRVWAQLTSLLQGVAQGTTLALLKVGNRLAASTSCNLEKVDR